MDFQVFVNTFSSACAVLSVKKGLAGHPSEVRIHKANDLYKETMGVARYRDDMLYSDMVPKDDKFEDFCYRCAVQKQKLHTYVETRYMNCWSDISFLPLEGGDDNISYCAFFFEFTKKPDAGRMSTISAEIASTVIKNCVILRSSTDFYSSLSLVLEDLLIKSGGVATCIIQVDRKNRDYEVLCEKFFSKEVSMKEHRSLLPYEVVETWDETIGGSDGIILKDNHDMLALEKINPLWAENLKQTLITSLILFPLMQGKTAMGYLFIANFDTQKLVQIKELASLTAFFLTSEISEHILVEKLERLGHEDLLTGVKNRNSMNNRVDLFVSGEQKIAAPFGVVFADLNGLKQMNDKKGHAAGDVLIKAAANCIKSVFTEDEIYRAGGDEFVIISPACSKEEFEEKVKKLKSKSCYGSQVSLAVGSDWNEDGDDLRHSMHLADEAMYRDKENFYKMHSDVDRRNKPPLQQI